MATSLTVRRSTLPTQKILSFMRLPSLTHLRNFTTASSSSTTAASSSSPSSSRKRKKMKNLFEVAQFLPNWGVGYHLAKSHWESVSYEITKINLYKDGRHGKAWGVAHIDGLPAADAPKKISGVHKRCWRYIPSLSKPKDSVPHSLKPVQAAATAEIQTA